MEQFICRPDLLELISIPAYTVKDGIVEAANGDAQNLLITPGTPAETLVETGLEDYNTLQNGCCLSLVIRAGEKRFCAFARRENDRDLFLLDQRISNQLRPVQVFPVHIHRGDLVVVIGGVVVYAFACITAGGI